MNMTLDVYIDYLICSTSYTTATGLSRLTNNAISHDKVTRFLSRRDFTESDLWSIAKPFCRSIEDKDGAILIDDSIEEKPYTDENELISWHFDHTKSKSVKGINFINALYETKKGTSPVGYKLVRKTKEIFDKKTGKKRRQSPVTKHEHYRDLLRNSVKNCIKFKYVLNDVWFASTENMRFVKREIKKDFVMPIKSNRKVALSEKEQAAKHFVGIDSLKLGENTLVWQKGLDFPLRLVCQVFKNGDSSTGVLYLVSSDIELTNEQITTIYKRRWKVEVYHKSLKSNVSLAKSPTKTPRTQANHFFASVCAYIRLESISQAVYTNHFAVKQKIYIEALKKAMLEIKKFCIPEFLQSENLEFGCA